MPGLRIIIDHLAGVAVDGKAPPADWVQQMQALVRRPNVYCKLSGLVEGTGRSDGQRRVTWNSTVRCSMRCGRCSAPNG